MLPPIRKRRKPLTTDEISYLESHYDDETIKLMKASDEEFDIPEVDELEDHIEEKFKSINGKPLDAYYEFIKYVDKFNITLKKFSPCKKGCAKCCKMPVAISRLERDIIKKHLLDNATKEHEIFDKLKEPHSHNGLLGGLYLNVACPFLYENECKIYPVRPYKCRSWIIFDNDNSLCDKYDVKVKIYNHTYSEMVYFKITNNYNYRKQLDNKIYDLRDCFRKL